MAATIAQTRAEYVSKRVAAELEPGGTLHGMLADLLEEAASVAASAAEDPRARAPWPTDLEDLESAVIREIADTMFAAAMQMFVDGRDDLEPAPRGPATLINLPTVDQRQADRVRETEAFQEAQARSFAKAQAKSARRRGEAAAT